MKYCPHCAEENSDDAKKCRRCKSNLAVGASRPVGGAPSVPKPGGSAPPLLPRPAPSSKSKYVVMGLLAVAGLLLVMAVGVFLLFQSKSVVTRDDGHRAGEGPVVPPLSAPPVAGDGPVSGDRSAPGPDDVMREYLDLFNNHACKRMCEYRIDCPGSAIRYNCAIEGISIERVEVQSRGEDVATVYTEYEERRNSQTQYLRETWTLREIKGEWKIVSRAASAADTSCLQAPTGMWTVQVKSWGGGEAGAESRATDLVNKFRAEGYDAYCLYVYVSEKNGYFYRVRVGGYSSQSEAEALALRLRKNKGIEGWVTR